jgi:hypothetical protein
MTGEKTAEIDNENSAFIEKLRARSWPLELTDVIIGDYENSPYVSKGRVFSRALRMHQQVSEPIPAGESGITSLCRGGNEKIYGATSGAKSHLFVYDPAPAADGTLDLGLLPGVKAVRRCIVSDGRSRVFVAASEMINGQEGGPLFMHDTAPDYTDEFRSFMGDVKQVTVPVPGECTVALCADMERAVLYGVSSKTGTFYSYDMESNTVKHIGPVSKDRAFSHCLVIDGKGNVYGTHSLGTLFRYSPVTQTVEDLGVRIPTISGREFYNSLDSAVLDPVSGLIYGAGSADGVLFSLDPETLDIRSLGKACPEPRVRALAIAPDGRLFGVAGNENGMGRLFCLDPARHELVELGIMLAASEVWRRGFEIDAACTGSNGEIYFGENEREGHLFIYFPAPPK